MTCMSLGCRKYWIVLRHLKEAHADTSRKCKYPYKMCKMSWIRYYMNLKLLWAWNQVQPWCLRTYNPCFCLHCRFNSPTKQCTKDMEVALTAAKNSNKLSRVVRQLQKDHSNQNITFWITFCFCLSLFARRVANREISC